MFYISGVRGMLNIDDPPVVLFGTFANCLIRGGFIDDSSYLVTMYDEDLRVLLKIL